jgi:hypothetical protein
MQAKIVPITPVIRPLDAWMLQFIELCKNKAMLAKTMSKLQP